MWVLWKQKSVLENPHMNKQNYYILTLDWNIAPIWSLEIQSSQSGPLLNPTGGSLVVEGRVR